MAWRRTAKRPPLEPETIDAIVRRTVALAARLDPARRRRLLELTAEIVDTRRWEAVGGLLLTDEVRVTIAANAAIPILSFDTWPYKDVGSIIVRPGSAASSGSRSGPAEGTISDEVIDVIGEALPKSGPVALSWDAALFDSRHPSRGCNVVIHEFAHKIDMNDGYADGVPPLRGPELERWECMLDDEFDHRESRPSDHVLRPYAWTNRAEFFAVATETFFCLPGQLQEAKPELYAVLSDLYQQDPAMNASGPAQH
ncbi:MAG: M90 family metallopeptidase [Actinomycetota bacterium]|nr:M90 family metallopeptidase [Actinomycetota bacterium]